MASEKSALKNERLALSALLSLLRGQKDGEGDLEMNGMVIHSKVNENPGSLLVHLSGERGGDEYGHATAEIRADAIKRDCLLFLIQWEGPWR